MIYLQFIPLARKEKKTKLEGREVVFLAVLANM
jgi:hypothetical protein